ncbi:MAG: S-layer homology domain-containing protein [Oscillospiraceae bacterium]|nr:S-layer homology domain-containing protein [Oscillospiraceae bacterium]
MQRVSFRRVTLTICCLALVGVMALPAYALFGRKAVSAATPVSLSRNVVLGQSLSFRGEDFIGTSNHDLASVTITTLPEHSSGILTVGGQNVSAGTVIHAQALDGLCFRPAAATTATTASFTATPTFSSGAQGEPVTVNIHLLTAPNQAPVAENMSLQTYRNVAVTGQLRATDPDSSELTYQLTSSPARGSVTLSEDSSGSFVYTPYENKTGKDSFTYVAVDSAGNISNPAKVNIRIEKARSGITYADMDGHPAHHAAMRLAEEGLLVGAQVNGLYFFAPDTPVSRSEFLALAMSAADLEPLEQVSLTGFYDDAAIAAWSKGYVSSALMAGAVSGTRNELGQAVFCPDRTVTRGEAAAMLDQLLNVSDVAVETWSAQGISHSTQDHWAMQSAADLTCAGVLTLEDSTPERLDTSLTRADAAQLLADSLDLLSRR